MSNQSDLIKYSRNSVSDLTLSGGVYLGGTGAANYLDDYEEGTFTPTVAFGGASSGLTYDQRAASYIKVGNIVHIWIHIGLLTKGSSTGHVSVGGLPFAADLSSSTGNVFAPIGDRGRMNTGGRPVNSYITHTNSLLTLYSGGFDGTPNAQVNHTHLVDNTEIDIVLSYPTS